MPERTLDDLLHPTLSSVRSEPKTWIEQRAHVRDVLPSDGLDDVQSDGASEALALRVAWANHFLVKAGLVRATGRGSYRATDDGEKWAQRPSGDLHIEHLRTRPSFAEWEDKSLSFRGMRSFGGEARTAPLTEALTWVPFFEELAEALLPFRERQAELVELLESLREQNLVITPLVDKDADGQSFLIREIDPFTFLGTMNRGITFQSRIAIAEAMKEHFAIDADVPVDFDGIPTMNNMASWFVQYAFKRGSDDVSKLWDVFQGALAFDPWASPEFEQRLDEAFALRGIKVNLTMGLFWVRPRTFLSLDRNVRNMLAVDVPTGGLTGSIYRDIEGESRKVDPYPIALSLASWLASQHLQDLETPQTGTDLAQPEPDTSRTYWLVGAFWDDGSQVERFLREGIWENGYEDKYLDHVREMEPGDKIAIKSAFTQRHELPFEFEGRTASVMRIHATGTITANARDGRRVEVDWDPDVEPRDWYHFTNQRTLWRLRTDSGYSLRHHSLRLIEFVWNGAPQDVEWYAQQWLAWKHDSRTGGSDSSSDAEDDEIVTNPYGAEDLKADGVFLDLERIDAIVDQLRRKKAMILQGPPGVGKTFIARRLAYAAMSEKAPSRVQMIQFHQSYSYDDFVRGFRPSTDGQGFALDDGVFLRFCLRAHEDPDHDYVFIIDEINRGNLSQIFGEMLMLIESDKRESSFAVPLTYSHADEERFYVPPNLYLIGLMNLADRSLAMVDYALRRRFAFEDLEPQYGTASFREWLLQRGMRKSLVDRIVHRMVRLNDAIGDHPLLGRNYRIGHSFFIPKGDDFGSLDETWFLRTVRTEIAPLLREYWFDDPTTAEQEIDTLTSG